MGNLDKFAEQIQKRLFRQEKEKAEKLLRIDRQMNQMLERREKYNSVANHILTTVVYPRMQELSRYFENSKLKEPGTVEGFQCICEFSPTDRFPAKVALNISFSPSGYFEHIGTHYALEITPALMKYTRYDDLNFNIESPSCEEDIGHWVETRIFDFIETYLQLETDPEYQKDKFVIDPVCDMRFPISQAAARIEKDGRTTYFCSETCKEAFLKEK